MAKNVNKIHKERMTFNEKIAWNITKKIGSMGAAYIFGLLTLVSLPAVIASGNTVVIIAWITQTFLQLVLLPIILVGQNIQSKHSELLAEKDYETDLRTEKDMEEIKDLLNKIHAKIVKSRKVK